MQSFVSPFMSNASRSEAAGGNACCTEAHFVTECLSCICTEMGCSKGSSEFWQWPLVDLLTLFANLKYVFCFPPHLYEYSAFRVFFFLDSIHQLLLDIIKVSGINSATAVV